MENSFDDKIDRRSPAWERYVWSFLSKECPFKHADRFEPLFNYIRGLLKEERERMAEEVEGIKPETGVAMASRVSDAASGYLEGFNKALSDAAGRIRGMK